MAHERPQMPAARENGVWRATPLTENCVGYNKLPRSGPPRFSCSYYFLVVHQAIYFSSLLLELVEKPYLLLLKLLLVGGLRRGVAIVACCCCGGGGGGGRGGGGRGGGGGGGGGGGSGQGSRTCPSRLPVMKTTRKKSTRPQAGITIGRGAAHSPPRRRQPRTACPRGASRKAWWTARSSRWQTPSAAASAAGPPQTARAVRP